MKGTLSNGTHRKPLLIIKEIAGFTQLCDGHFGIWRAFDMLVSRDKVVGGPRKPNKSVSEFICNSLSLAMQNLIE